MKGEKLSLLQRCIKWREAAVFSTIWRLISSGEESMKKDGKYEFNSAYSSHF